MEHSRKPDKDAPFVLNVTPALQEILHARRDAVEAERTARARLAALDRQLLDSVEPLWREQCREAGVVRRTVIIDDGHGGKAEITFPRLCKFISMDEEGQLRAIFGDEDFDRYFEVRSTFSLDYSQFSAEHWSGLVQLLGDAAESALVFDTKIMVRDTYLQDRVLNERIESLAAKAESQELVVLVRPRVEETGTSSASNCNPAKRS